MSAEERALRLKARDDYPWFAERCLTVRTKAGPLAKLKLNRAQLFLHERLERQLAETGRVRALVVKARKQGCSTYIAGRHYHKVTHRFGFRAFILTHLADATDNLFEMVERFHEHNNPLLKPQTGATNAKELSFPLLDGGYKVGTAGSANVGRSDTIQLFHGSESAFWPKAEDHAGGILQAIPDEPGTEIILESTTNGLGNYFANAWKDAVAGVSGYIAIFIPWFWTDEYRATVPEEFELSREDETYQQAYGLDLEQMAWRRQKIVDLKDEWRFMQEFPSTAEEAFQASGEGNYIKPVLVAKARHTKIQVGGYIPIVIGIDPARGGRDRTGVIDRQGRKAGGIVNEDWREGDVTKLCGKVVLLIKRVKPKKVIIDSTEGTGAALVDLLTELGYGKIVFGVKFSESAIADDLYLNKRAEMYAEMLEWFSSPLGVEIPDDDDLQAEICAAIWGPAATHHTRNGLLQIEPKEHIVKRLKRSPDRADALALTFAIPIVAVKPDGPPLMAPPGVDPAVNY